MTSTSASIQLLEMQTCEGLTLTVDSAAGVIRGVKILGRKSANGREYSAEAITRAAKLYEGTRVNVDHVDGHRRSYRDRLGHLAGVTIREDGLYGDLHYNPKHPLAEQLAWDAQHAPRNVGLSHDARGRTRKHGRTVIVEEIEAVKSVDLVADPATTAGLFEDVHQKETNRVELKEAGGWKRGQSHILGDSGNVNDLWE